MKKFLSYVVATLAVVNLGLFAMTAQVSAKHLRTDWTCGCQYNEQFILEPVCISFLYAQCPDGDDPSLCPPCQ
jgi:hypothetical protein